MSSAQHAKIRYESDDEDDDSMVIEDEVSDEEDNASEGAATAGTTGAASAAGTGASSSMDHQQRIKLQEQQQKTNLNLKRPRHEFSKQDDEQLLAAFEQEHYRSLRGDLCGLGYTFRWQKICDEVFGGRIQAGTIQKRAERLINANMKKGEWTPEEDATVLELYKKYGSKYSLIAKEMRYSRIGMQIGSRLHILLYKLQASDASSPDSMIDSSDASKVTMDSKKRQRESLELSSESLEDGAGGEGGKPTGGEPIAKRARMSSASDQDEMTQPSSSTANAQQATVAVPKFMVIKFEIFDSLMEERSTYKKRLASSAGFTDLVDLLSNACGVFLEKHIEDGNCCVQYLDDQGDWIQMSLDDEDWVVARDEYLALRTEIPQGMQLKVSYNNP